jgi:hypothetical protein
VAVKDSTKSEGLIVTRKKALIAHANEAWRQAVADMYHPPLPDVRIEYNISNHDYFYIEPATWQVHLNVAGISKNMPDGLVEQHLRSICQHEIQHYTTCPYDGVTSGLMFSAARKYLRDDVAMFVCNIFADLVVDGDLLTRFPDLTIDRMVRSIESASQNATPNSWLWRLVVSCYHILFGIAIPDWVMDEDFEALAEDITDIVIDYERYMNKWHKAVGKIAKLLASRFNQDDMNYPRSGGKLEAGEGDPSGLLPNGGVPQEGMHGDPSKLRTGDDAKKAMAGKDDYDMEGELERMLAEAERRGATLDDIKAICQLAGCDTGDRTWLRVWYKVIARRRIKFNITTKRKRGKLAISPKPWRLGDPIEDLDVITSLQVCPVMIPNVTTRTWEKAYYDGAIESEDLPDLLIVIDSSGSMTWHGSSKRTQTTLGRYHTALIGAFSAMDIAIRKGVSVAVINFSGTSKVCGWTKRRRDLEDVLLQYQGQGTVMPCKAIEDLCNEHRKPVLVLFITDAEVNNHRSFIKTVSNLTKRNHKIVMFTISEMKGKRNENIMKELASAGAVVIATPTAKDLDGLIIRETKGIYIKNARLPKKITKSVY